MGQMTQQTGSGGLYFCNEREFAIGGHCKAILANLKGSASYATGGDNLDSQLIGAGNKGKIAFVGNVMTDSGTYYIRAKRTDINNVKIMWFVTATNVEVANAVDLSAEKFTTLIAFIP